MGGGSWADRRARRFGRPLRGAVAPHPAGARSLGLGFRRPDHRPAPRPGRRADRRPRPLRPAAMDRRRLRESSLSRACRGLCRPRRRALPGPCLLVHAAERAAHHGVVLRQARLVAAFPARLARIRLDHDGGLPRHRANRRNARRRRSRDRRGPCRRDRPFRSRRSGSQRRGAAATGDRVPGSRPRQRAPCRGSPALRLADRQRSRGGRPRLVSRARDRLARRRHEPLPHVHAEAAPARCGRAAADTDALCVGRPRVAARPALLRTLRRAALRLRDGIRRLARPPPGLARRLCRGHPRAAPGGRSGLRLYVVAALRPRRLGLSPGPTAAGGLPPADGPVGRRPGARRRPGAGSNAPRRRLSRSRCRRERLGRSPRNGGTSLCRTRLERLGGTMDCAMFRSFFLAGFEGSTGYNRHGRWFDQVAATGHDKTVERDYRDLAALGIHAARETVRWPLVDRGGGYDFSSLAPFVEAARRNRVEVIWDLFHYGYPRDVDLWSDRFPERFADYCHAVARHIARESRGTPYFTPVNEPSFMAYAGGEKGLFAPHGEERGWELKIALVRAAIAGIDAIRSVCPDARIVNVDPLCRVACPEGRPELAEEARDFNERLVFQAWDMLAGRLMPELGGSRDHLDIVGINYYWTNQWEWRILLVDGKIPPLGEDDRRRLPLRELVGSVWERYRSEIIISETSHIGDRRGAWLGEVAAEVEALLRQGEPQRGVYVYPILGMPEWHDPDIWTPMGLWDPVCHREPCGDRLVCQPMLDALHAARYLDALAAGYRQVAAE